MSICWSSTLIVANVNFTGATGAHIVNGFGIRFSLAYSVLEWAHGGIAPMARLSPAIVTLPAKGDMPAGYAVPETTVPFSSTNYIAHHLHTLVLNASEMEAVERIRAGQDIAFHLKLQGELWRGAEFQPIHKTVECRIAQSEWLKVLDQCGYGRSIVFEVPLPASDDPAAPASAQYLEQARVHYVKGHYDDAVAACRKALEAIDPSQKKAAENAASAWRGGGAKELTLEQRELVIRQVVTQYTHLAHHHEPEAETVRYDRSTASMVLGLTASLLSRMNDYA